MDNLRTFPVEKLQSFGEQAFEKVGVPKEDAQLMTRSLVEADLRNVSTHGVVRLPVYVNRIRDGWIVPVAEPEIVSQSATTAVIDGKNGLGQVVG
ncbi:MAG: Ldh family oxidoreductase, partial [Limnochordia bacterium]